MTGLRLMAQPPKQHLCNELSIVNLCVHFVDTAALGQVWRYDFCSAKRLDLAVRTGPGRLARAARLSYSVQQNARTIAMIGVEGDWLSRLIRTTGCRSANGRTRGLAGRRVGKRGRTPPSYASRSRTRLRNRDIVECRRVRRVGRSRGEVRRAGRFGRGARAVRQNEGLLNDAAAD